MNEKKSSLNLLLGLGIPALAYLVIFKNPLYNTYSRLALILDGLTLLGTVFLSVKFIKDRNRSTTGQLILVLIAPLILLVILVGPCLLAFTTQ